MKKLLLLSIFLPFLVKAQTGTQTQVDRSIQGNTWHTYVFKAANYATNTSKSYPLIVFFPGLGQTGGAATQLLVYGPAKMINDATWNGTATYNSITDTFLVISMQCPFTNCYVQQGTVSAILDSLSANYRVDANRIYLTGLSAGGFAADNYITANGNSTELAYASRPAAIVAMSAVVPNYPYVEFKRYGPAGGRWWGITGVNDQRNYPDIVNNLEAGKVGTSRVTYFSAGGGGHCCWNTYYDPGYTENFVLNGISGNWNIYQWMAAQTKAAPGPIVSVGSDRVIYLPTNSASLTSTVTPAAGTTISTYAWTRTSGPNTPTFGTASAQNTTISGLIQGSYVIRQTATDNNAASSFDELTITVNADAAPTVNAGIDQSITLPISQVTVSGSYTDVHGTAPTIGWTKISGPSGSTITTPSALQTTITGLVAGTYVFRLSVTGIGGLTGTDDISIIVSGSAPASGVVNVNIYGGTNPYSNSQWNDWNVGTVDATNKVITGLLKDDGATNSGISATLSNVQVLGDNGATYGGTMCPPEVLRYTSGFSGTTRTLSLSGLDNTKTYTIKLYASRNNTGNTTTFSIPGQPNQVITTDGNKTNIATFSAVQPSGGAIVVTMTKGSSFSYINGFTINIGTGGGTNLPPTADAGIDKTITLPTNSSSASGSGSDPDGSIASYAWTQSSGPNTAGISAPSSASTNFTGLIAGTYVFTLTVTDNLGATGSDQMGVIVNAAGAVLQANAGVNFNQADTIPVTILDAVNTTGGTPPYTYVWRNLQKQNANPWSARIMNYTSSKTLVNWTGLFGTYSYELTVTDNVAATSKDTITVTVFYSNPAPPQKVEAAGWHYATETDVANIWSANLNDVIIPGATTDAYNGPNNPGNKTIFLDFTLGGGFKMIDGRKILIAGGKYLDITLRPNKDSVQCALNGQYVVTNYNGQVETQSIEFGPLFHQHFTGEYSVANKTGDINYPGTYGAQGTYGFFINNGFRSPDKFIINMTASDSVRGFEMDHFEYGNGGFAWVFGKANSVDMYNVHLHHFYGHDTHGEGMYFGRTESNQALLNNWELNDFRMVRAGNEAMQIVNIGQNNYIHNGVTYMSGFNRRSTFDLDQDFNFQVGVAVGGNNRYRKLMLMGAGEQIISYIMNSHAEIGVHTTGFPDTLDFTVMMGNSGNDINFIGDQDSGTFKLVYNNNYHGFNHFRGGEIFTGSRGTNTAEMIRLQQNVSPQETYTITNNSYDATKSTFLSSTTGVTQSNNNLNSPAFPKFNNSGWADSMDISKVTMYADTIFWTDRSENPSIGERQYSKFAYDSGMYVGFQGKFFQSRVNANTNPLYWETDANWLQITWNGRNQPPDDLRLLVTDPYSIQGIGLTDKPTNPCLRPNCIPHMPFKKVK